MKNIVCIGGGTGSAAVLRALKDRAHVALIASMADDGGSTGVLRREEHVLPPGSVRPALVALAPPSPLRDAFAFRFHNGHGFGNLFLGALEKTTGSFEKAIAVAGDVLKVKGDIFPVTLDDVRLVAELNDGTILQGEHEIDVPHGDRAAIKRVWLTPEARMNPRAAEAIARADLIIIGPGDLYTSVIPNFLVGGISEAVKQSKAKKVYLCNLMTKHGETDGYSAENFVKAIETYIPVDVIVCNNKMPNKALLARYREAKSEFVKPSNKYTSADLLAEDGFIRHDSGEKLARVLLDLTE